jgi:hypothetical protein
MSCGPELEECLWFGVALRKHIFDTFRKSSVVPMLECRLVPASQVSKACEFDVILQNFVVVLHPEVVNAFW